MFSTYKTTLLLATCQSLAMSCIPMLLLVGSFIGIQLAPSAELATLPLACMVVGTALGTLPMAMLMQRLDRKPVFIGALLLAAGLCIGIGESLKADHFLGLCLGVTGLGVCLASIQQYRFAAINSVPTSRAATATAIIIFSGIVAAFVGPELGLAGRHLTEVDYQGSFWLCAISLILAALLLSLGLKNSTASSGSHSGSARSLKQLFTQPYLWLAISTGAVGYSLMSFIMTATPLSMHEGHGHSLTDTKWVIQSHLLAMFAPSLFTPWLIKRFGFNRVIIAGLGAYGLTIIVGLSGSSFGHYWWALVALGLGWNFLFVSGTSLLPRCYESHEQFKVQGTNDACIFSSQAIASLSAGWLLSHLGWQGVLWISLPFLLLPMAALGLVWHRTKHHSAP